MTLIDSDLFSWVILRLLIVIARIFDVYLQTMRIICIVNVGPNRRAMDVESAGWVFESPRARSLSPYIHP